MITEDFQRRILRALAVAALLLTTMVPGTTHFMLAATVAYALQLVGLSYRRIDRRTHIRMMALSIVLDLGIVLILQVTREAVKTATSFTLSVTDQLHILFSLLAVVCYIPIIYFGMRSKQESSSHKASYHRWHRLLGMSGFSFRSLGFVFMFSMVK